MYGEADPNPLTTGNAVAAGLGTGFLAGDNVTATYSRVAGASVAGSPYAITAVLSAAAACSTTIRSRCRGQLHDHEAAGDMDHAGCQQKVMARRTRSADDGQRRGGRPGDGLPGGRQRDGDLQPGGRRVGGRQPYAITAVLSAAAGVLDNYTVTNAGASFTSRSGRRHGSRRMPARCMARRTRIR